MFQAFRDHFRDAVETAGTNELRFWLGVVGDESKSLLREHLAALTGRDRRVKKLVAVGLPHVSTTALLIVAVVLTWAVPLSGQMWVASGFAGQVARTPYLSTYYATANLATPDAGFVAAFEQGMDAMRTSRFGYLHLTAQRVAVSSNPVISSVPGAPAVIIDGDPAARFPDDLRVVEGRLPQPSANVLEVALTARVAQDYHLTVGDALPLAAYPAPNVRVVGLVAPTGAAFPVQRAILTIYEDDPIRSYAQSNPVDSVLTSNEAIEAYGYDWSRVPLTTLIGNGCSGPHHAIGPECFVKTPWLVKWIAQSQTPQMSVRDLNELFYGAQSDYPALINTMLQTADPAAIARAGLTPTDTGWQAIRSDEIGDYRDGAVLMVIPAWMVLGVVLWLILLNLAQVVRALARQGVNSASRDHGVNQPRLVRAYLVRLAIMTLFALAVGGVIVQPVVLLLSRALHLSHERVPIDALSGGPTIYMLVGGVSAAVVLMVAFVALGRAFARAVAEYAA